MVIPRRGPRVSSSVEELFRTDVKHCWARERPCRYSELGCLYHTALLVIELDLECGEEATDEYQERVSTYLKDSFSPYPYEAQQPAHSLCSKMQPVGGGCASTQGKTVIIIRAHAIAWQLFLCDSRRGLRL